MGGLKRVKPEVTEKKVKRALNSKENGERFLKRRTMIKRW